MANAFFHRRLSPLRDNHVAINAKQALATRKWRDFWKCPDDQFRTAVTDGKPGTLDALIDAVFRHLSDIARWSGELSRHEIAMAENYCAKNMRRVGQRPFGTLPYRLRAKAMRGIADISGFLAIWITRLKGRLPDPTGH